jgi:tetratricopeptide (TPR) repeat protein
VIAVTPLGPSAADSDPVTAARDAEQRGAFELAAESYREAVQLHPDDSDLRLDLARNLAWSKQFDRSAEAYRELLQLEPGLLEARLGLAEVLSWGGHYQEAAQAYRGLLEDYPERIELYLKIADVCVWARWFDSAEKWLRQALPHVESRAEVLARLGQLAYWHGRYDEAIDLYEQALALEPEDADADEGLKEVLRSFETYVTADFEYSVLAEIENWSRVEFAVSGWLARRWRLGFSHETIRRFGTQEQSLYGWVERHQLPHGLSVRVGAGYSPDSFLLAGKRLTIQVSRLAPGIGASFSASYERLDFELGGVNVWVPLSVSVSRWEPWNLSGALYLIHDIDDRLRPAGWGTIARQLSSGHTVFGGLVAGLDPQQGLSLVELGRRRVLGPVGGVHWRLGPRLSLNTLVRMQFMLDHNDLAEALLSDYQLDVRTGLAFHF